MVKIVTDSTSDVPPEVAAELGISIVPVVLVIDGASYLDGVTLTRRQFYSNLGSYREIPRTAAPGADVFANVYRSLRASGADEIVSIHLNRRFSVLLQIAEVAARDVANEGLRVSVVDSQSVTMGLGWLVITAARMVLAGATAAEIVSHVESLRPHLRIYAVVDTLRYLRRSGRANALMAGLGDMLQIKILLGVRNGLVEQIDRVRTRARGLSRMLEVAHTHRGVHHLSVLHTSDGQDADVGMLRERCSDLVPFDQQYAIQVTPVLGAHVGPLAVGVAMLSEGSDAGV